MTDGYVAIQGVGGGGIASLASVILSDMVSLSERSKFQAIYARYDPVSHSLSGPVLNASTVSGRLLVAWVQSSAVHSLVGQVGDGYSVSSSLFKFMRSGTNSVFVRYESSYLRIGDSPRSVVYETSDTIRGT